MNLKHVLNRVTLHVTPVMRGWEADAHVLVGDNEAACVRPLSSAGR